MKLLPCPYCGRERQQPQTEDVYPFGYIYYISCTFCHCRGPFTNSSTEHAGELWNMRDMS